ncbi:hypothetical protein TNCV_4234201 [Trichonephila clavipes]|nr:hypothetical protein TNCV_4234201 [Trichonephila clavipes]
MKRWKGDMPFQWVRSLVGLITSAGTGEYFLPFSFHAEIVEVEIEVVSPSIVHSGNFTELNRTVTCKVLKANDRRTSCPCHDEFRGPRSDYVRQVAIENNKQQTVTQFAPQCHGSPRRCMFVMYY